jgi:hypothetical protein
MLNKHPNASVASSAGVGGALICWLLGHFGVDVSAEIGALIATGVAGFVLFVGRNGLVGLAHLIWRGSGG